MSATGVEVRVNSRIIRSKCEDCLWEEGIGDARLTLSGATRHSLKEQHDVIEVETTTRTITSVP